MRILQEIVEVLATKIRVVTDDQVGETWFGEVARPKESGRAALRRLEAKGMVRTVWTMARPRLSLDGPLFCYRGRETPEPDFGRLAWKAAHRFKKPLVRTFVAKATQEARLAFGQETFRRSERTSEITHDSHLSDIYLRLRKHSPELAKLWVGEDFLPHDSDVRPDAMVGEVAVDFIGQYSAEKLARLFERYVQAFEAFELW